MGRTGEQPCASMEALVLTSGRPVGSAFRLRQEDASRRRPLLG